MKLPVLLAIVALVSPCDSTTAADEKPKEGKPAQITYAGGDGSSFEKAVVIKGATEGTGVDAEYRWLSKNYPSYRMRRQSLKNNGGKAYDVLAITTKDGKELNVYFDITGFFGKN